MVWESLRVRNPVNYGHYKVVPPGGDTFHGIYLPAGTAIGHNTLGLARREATFGKDANVYRPERFFRTPYRSGLKHGEVEMDKERIKAVDITFGGGRWMCSGKQVAIYELNKIIFEVSLFPSSGFPPKAMKLTNKRCSRSLTCNLLTPGTCGKSSTTSDPSTRICGCEYPKRIDQVPLGIQFFFFRTIMRECVHDVKTGYGN